MPTRAAPAPFDTLRQQTPGRSYKFEIRARGLCLPSGAAPRLSFLQVAVRQRRGKAMPGVRREARADGEPARLLGCCGRGARSRGSGPTGAAPVALELLCQEPRGSAADLARRFGS